ncbi:MAG: response regulator transcription factor [Planctomycetaceae bacterium]|nr:response regulator transcription factor [Planctomycetaceae bacterium]
MNSVADSITSSHAAAPREAPRTPTVALVEDDLSVQDCLGAALGARGYVVRPFDSAEAFLRSAPGFDTLCCVVVDLHLRGSSGWEVIGGLRDVAPHSGLVVVSAHLDVRSVVRAMLAGASAVLEKPVCLDEFLDAVRRGCENAEHSRRQERLRIDAGERLARLSAREREVFDRVVAGLASKNIAFELGISIRTVEAFRSRILSKTGARSTAELVRLDLLARGKDEGALPPPPTLD